MFKIKIAPAPQQTGAASRSRARLPVTASFPLFSRGTVSTAPKEFAREGIHRPFVEAARAGHHRWCGGRETKAKIPAMR
jgi:hypothetical protein